MNTWKSIIDDQLRKDLPQLQAGDIVDVHYRVVEGEKERIQVFSGTVIRLRGSGMGYSVTVRKIASSGIGVERVFPMNSPFIGNIVVKKQSSVRRAKLYYIRERRGKAARLKEKATTNKS